MMTAAFFGVGVFHLAVLFYAIRKVRGLRGQLVRNNAYAFKQQARRAHAFQQFCEPCKKIAAPWWKP